MSATDGAALKPIYLLNSLTKKKKRHIQIWHHRNYFHLLHHALMTLIEKEIWNIPSQMWHSQQWLPTNCWPLGLHWLHVDIIKESIILECLTLLRLKMKNATPRRSSDRWNLNQRESMSGATCSLGLTSKTWKKKTEIWAKKLIVTHFNTKKRLFSAPLAQQHLLSH